MFEIIGIAGIAISVAAYVPQVTHIALAHCSAGVSSRAWGMWLASSVLVGTAAMHRRDPVFILLQACTLTSAAVILFLARRYKGMACEFHTPPVPKVAPVAPAGPDEGQRPVVLTRRRVVLSSNEAAAAGAASPRAADLTLSALWPTREH